MNRLPSREELLAFIRERSGKVGTREIARAFGAKNADRAALNRMLRELAEQGLIDRRRKRLHHPGTLPPVVLADITGRDSDGELLARPTEWDEDAHGAAPVIHIATPRRARPGEVAGVGDRALIRIDETRDEETSGRVIKLIDRAKRARSASSAVFPAAAGGWFRSTRSSSAANSALPPMRRPARWTATWSRSKWRDTAGLGWPPARSWSGSVRSRASAPSA